MKAKTLGIIGGGQLGRMLTQAAHRFGYNVIVINPEPNGPAAQVGAKEIVAGFYDKQAIRQLAEQSDWLTYEIEHTDAELLIELKASGKAVGPDPETLAMIQDKFVQKTFLAEHNIPVADFAPLTGEFKQARRVFTGYADRMVIKTKRGGYDGRGNRMVTKKHEIRLHDALADFVGQDIYAERAIWIRKELACMVAKGADGSTKVYPVVETIHKRNILQLAICPAPLLDSEYEAAEKLAVKTAELLGGPGMYCIEMFLATDGRLMVNEIAPRVHNSGHLSIEANRTSQFEQHVRAVTGLPLGDIKMVVPAAVMGNILGIRDGEPKPVFAQALEIPGLSIHMYGKSPVKVDRKMGHFTLTSISVRDAVRRADAARRLISI